jgi:hypothetical protein
MATFRGVNNTLAQPGPTKAPVAGGDGGGNPRLIYDEYTTVGTEVVNDVIEMGPPLALKKGDRIVGAFMNNDVCAAGALAALGDDGNTLRFLAATAISAAAHTQMTNGNVGFQLDQDRPIRVTLTGAAPGANHKIRVGVYVLRS